MAFDPRTLLAQVPQAAPVGPGVPEDVRAYVEGLQAPALAADVPAPPTEAERIDSALASDARRQGAATLAANVDRYAQIYRGEPAGPMNVPALDDNMRAYVMKHQMAQQDADRAYKQGDFGRQVALAGIKSKLDAEEFARRFGLQAGQREQERGDERAWREDQTRTEREWRAEQARLDREARLQAAKDARDARTPADQKVTDELRKELQGQQVYKDAQTVAASYEKVKTASPSAAGDIGLIFGIMKIFDPNSVVRETEYATAQNAGGVPEKFRNAWNKARDGEFLTPQQRASFRAEAEKVYNAQRARYDATAKEYRRLAEKRGIPPEDVVFDVFGPKSGVGSDKVTVSNGKETFTIPRSDLAEAKADGFQEVQ